MDKRIKLSIGEFSKLCGVTVKTLRHYEKTGLLKPEEVDQWSGYRYYTVSQMQVMMRIRALKDLGLSLDEIYELSWETGDGNCTMFFEPDPEMLRGKLAECESELARLGRRKEALQKMLDSRKKKEEMEKFYTTSLPEITVASYRAEVDGWTSLMGLCPEVIGPEMAKAGCTCPEPGYCYIIDHDEEHKEAGKDLEYCEQIDRIPEGAQAVDANTSHGVLRFRTVAAVPKAVCMKVYGPYDRLPEGYAEIYAYIEQNGLEIAGEARCSFVDGIWNTEDPEKWMSVIQIPVR